MAKILEMPKLAPTMEEGVLAIWHKKAGDAVQVDDLLAEVETDKATMEFRAFDKGTILKLLVEPGAKVLLGQPVAILGNPGEDTAGLAAEAGGGAGAPAPQGGAGRTSAPPTPAAASRAGTPVEHGAVGSGPGGRIVAGDLDGIASTPANGSAKAIVKATNGDTGGAMVRAPAQPSHPAQPRLAEPDVRPLSPMRKTIARRLTESKQ